jgi:hypothetical protein
VLRQEPESKVSRSLPDGNSKLRKINIYVPYSECRISPNLLVALLNSKLLDWYFRLGSTNSKVNEYQFNNLPCPIFSEEKNPSDSTVAVRAVMRGDLEIAFQLLELSLTTTPFSAGISDALISASERIITIESARGEVNKRNRSALSEQAQIYQDFIDRMLFRMAGLSDDERQRLEQRLSEMM